MKKILVIGAGESGLGAARLAKQQGYDVLLSDAKKISASVMEVCQKEGIRVEEQGHLQAMVFGPDEVIKSQGIPMHVPIVEHFLDEVPIIDEIEFAHRYKGKAKVIAITGSNGKTTTTMLTHHVMQVGGLNAGLAGNVGKSWAGQLADGVEKEVWVLELSSFQLEGLVSFEADISIITNVTPDHLDRYKDFEHYLQTKLKLMSLTKGFGLFWNGDPHLKSFANGPHDGYTTFLGYGEKNGNAKAYTEEEKLILKINGEMSMSIKDLALAGKHNVANSMAAGLAGRLMDLRKESIRTSLESFENIAHRLEFVAHVAGVEFVNDSKSTNVNSAWYALDSATKPIVWIAGGVDKGNDYDSLIELARLKVKALIILGSDNEKMRKAFEGVVPVIFETDNIRTAVGKSYEMATKGDQVLLSPVCASFDLFENYEDRGNQFKALVKSL